MIRGAVEIFGEIPAVYLNPFLVAESQEEAMRGFIVVAYLPEEDLKRYDLLFLRGPEVYECISLDEVRRVRTDMDAAHCRFKSHIKQGHTLIYLFEAGESLTQHFISTVYTEPIIKVKVETLSKQQIQRLLRSAGCARPLAERIDFSRKLPSVEIREIDPLSPGLEFHIGFKQGGFFLYDLADMAVRQAATAPVAQAVQTELAFEPTVAEGTGQAVRDDFAQLTNGETSREGIQKSLPGADREPVDEADREPRRATGRNADQPHSDPLHKRPVRKRSKLAQNSARAHQPGAQATGPQPDASAGIHRKDAAVAGPRPDAPAADPQQDALVETQGGKPAHLQVSEQEFVRVLDRLYRSFRQHVYGCLGRKSESIIAKSERRLQLLNPEFSTGSLDESTAPLVLDLIDDVIKHAPWLRRSKLRSAALTLVADLFTKQYELLERYRAVDKVEQIYYRMKK